MTPVALTSSVLHAVDYDGVTRKLTLVMKSGKRYVYAAVPVAEYQNLLLAKSPGTYYNQHIKGKYTVIAQA